jgi:CBS domain-containing protein
MGHLSEVVTDMSCWESERFSDGVEDQSCAWLHLSVAGSWGSEMRRSEVCMTEAEQTQVKYFMTVRTARIRHTSNIQHAAELVALSNVSDLMVVDEDDNFRGVLSEGDILRTALPDIDQILEEGGSLVDAFGILLDKGRALSALPITSLIIDEPLVVDPDDHVARAATVLLDRQIRVLPVVKAGKLVGTVSRGDLCRAIVGTL